MPKILELSNRMSKGGRKKIDMVLLTIHEAQKTNFNGIHWKESYVLDNLDSIKSIPICCEFLSEEKDEPNGHGFTEVTELEGKDEPVFLNSETVGTIESADIQDVMMDGKIERVLVGHGYIYCQRYPHFTEWLKQNIAINEVKSSIEIMGTEENDRKIVYDGGYNLEYRIPQVFDFSGTAILGRVKEADENCFVLEVAQKNKKEEKSKMDEKELKEIIVSTITETNVNKENTDKIIATLQDELKKKDEEIKKLTEGKADVEANVCGKEKEIEELKEKYEDQKKKLDEVKVKELNAAFDEKLKAYTDDQKKCVETEINAYHENPLDGNANDIISKICIGIVNKQIEDAKVAEQNSKKNDHSNIDIFAEVNSTDGATNKEEDVNIF